MCAQNMEQAAGSRQPKRRRIRFNGNQEADDAVATSSSPQRELAPPSADGVPTAAVASSSGLPKTPQDGSAEQATAGAVTAATTTTAAGMFFGGLKPMQGVRYCFVGFSEHDRVCTLLLSVCISQIRYEPSGQV